MSVASKLPTAQSRNYLVHTEQICIHIRQLSKITQVGHWRAQQYQTFFAKHPSGGLFVPFSIILII